MHAQSLSLPVSPAALLRVTCHHDSHHPLQLLLKQHYYVPSRAFNKDFFFLFPNKDFC